jgi:glycosyltransferase involved in cell wall biosynthesis
MITLFTPSFVDEGDTNAQNLSVKEIIARLDPERFAVTMFQEGGPVDPRILSRSNTTLLPWRKRANTVHAALRLLTRPPDIYFFPREGPLDATFLSLRRSLRLNTALVTYIVTGGLYNGEYPDTRVRNIREADVVIANNNYLGRLLMKKMGVAAETVYDGVDRRIYFPPAEGRNNRTPLTVLFAGSLRLYKRVPLFVRQAARWPQVRFRIAGTGEEDQICKALAAELKCANVEFLGHLPQPAVAEEMRRADIFLFPSILEGHPQVLLQAAASGLPSVAMEIYRPDAIVDGSTGFLARTDAEFAEKLDFLISRSETRLAMGHAATEHARKFDWDLIAAQWQGIFERVITKRRNA